MRAFHPVHARPRRAALRFALLVAAVATTAGACSTTKSAGTTSPPSQQEATTLVDAVVQTTEAVLAELSAGTQAQAVRLAPRGMGPVTYPCSAGGTATVSAGATGVNVTFAACDTGSGILDGSLFVDCTASGSSITQRFDGAVTVQLLSSAGTTEAGYDVTFRDLTITFSIAGGETSESGSLVIDNYPYSQLSLDLTAGAPTACPGFSDDGGLGDAGACGSGCSIAVCPAGSNCAGSGLSPATVSCAAVVAQYDDASGLTSIPIANCAGDSTAPLAAISLTGQPTATTYASTSPLIEGSAVVCAGSLAASYWVAGPASADDGGALGGFTLVLSSVTVAPNAPGNATTEYIVHGTLQAECLGGPTETGAAPASGTVTMTVTF